MQTFRLTPDEQPRILVHAQWPLDGKPAFLLSAWIRSEPEMQVEEVQSRPSARMRRCPAA